jgi:hypothetical protein
MDLYYMYEKKEKKNNQKENYLTETIAFLCNVSDKFKKIYLKDFLKINGDISKLRIDTQVRNSGAKDNKRPDMIIFEGEKIIAVCEHKLDADIGNSQLDNYYNNYKDKQPKFILIHSKEIESKSIKSYKLWDRFEWKNLFIKLKNEVNQDFLEKEFDLDDLSEKIDKNKTELLFQFKDLFIKLKDEVNPDFLEKEFDLDDLSEKIDKKENKTELLIINCLLDLFYEFDIWSYSDYDYKKLNLYKFPEKVLEELKNFKEYQNLLKEIKSSSKEIGGYGKSKSITSKIKWFIEEGGINTKIKDQGKANRIGIYNWADEFYFQECDNDMLSRKLDINKIKKIYEFQKNSSINFNSEKEFNEQFDKTHLTLTKAKDFLSFIINEINQSPEINIIDKKIQEDDYGFYIKGIIKNKEVHFNIGTENSSEHSYMLFIQKKLNKKGWIKFEDNDDYYYKKLNLNSLIDKNPKEQFELIKNFYKKAIKEII